LVIPNGQAGHLKRLRHGPDRPGPACMRFTTASTAVSAAAGGVILARDTQINGFAVQGGGASFQFDTLPFANTGGVSPFGATDVCFLDGLREVGKGPFLRVMTPGIPIGPFYFRYIDDDAPNAAIGN